MSPLLVVLIGLALAARLACIRMDSPRCKTGLPMGLGNKFSLSRDVVDTSRLLLSRDVAVE